MNDKEQFVIRIIDDEEPILFSLNLLLEIDGWKTECYSNPLDFLKNVAPSVPGCVLSDIKMPRMSGLDLFETMKEREINLPVIFISGHGDIEMAVDAMKEGASDFLIKPVKEAKLFSAINKAVNRYRKSGNEIEFKRRIKTLSSRELAVLRLMLDGVDTKNISRRLSIGERTVQGHRWRIYQKLELNSVEQVIEIIKPEWLP